LFYAISGEVAGSLAVLSAISWAWGPAGVAGLVGMGVFGINAAWALHRLFRRKARLRITEQGIIDEQFWYSPGLIKWDEILDVRPSRWGYIEIDLADKPAYFRRLSGLAQTVRAYMRLWGFGPAAISSWGLEASRGEIIEALETGMDSYALSMVRQADALESGGESATAGYR
jgi:hypothetical protein